jgi:hypothetical protein
LADQARDDVRCAAGGHSDNDTRRPWPAAFPGW